MERNLFKALIGLVICAMVFSFAPASQVLAAGTWYVRQDGSDNPATCDGTADVAYPDRVGTACAFATIQKGVTTAAAGDTVHVGPGPFTLPALVISQSVNLVGSGSNFTLLKPTADAGATGWIHVNPGVTFSMSGFALDGTGFNIERAIQSFGNSTIQNNRFQNITAPSSLGIAISAFNSSIVSNNQFTNIGRVGILIRTDPVLTTGTNTSIVANNVYVGKGVGAFLDYGIEIGAGAHATVTGNVVTNNKGIVNADDYSAGIYVESYFAPNTNATLTSNSLTNNHAGILVGYKPDPSIGYEDNSTVIASFNRIYGNVPNGLLVVGTKASVTATNNWWGCNSGPTDANCDSLAGSATVSPYLRLTAGTDFSSAPLATVNVTANMKMNSAGTDTSGSGFVPNDSIATFLTYKNGVLDQGGTVSPVNVNAALGVFTTAYTAPAVPAGTPVQVCASVDNVAVCSNVTIQNVAPVAVADSYNNILGDHAFTTTATTGVLKNDTDANLDILTAVVNTPPAHGTLTLNADGSFTFTPAAGYTGPDSFTYHANDGTADSNVATVTLIVSKKVMYLPMIMK